MQNKLPQEQNIWYNSLNGHNVGHFYANPKLAPNYVQWGGAAKLKINAAFVVWSSKTAPLTLDLLLLKATLNLKPIQKEQRIRAGETRANKVIR